MARGDLAVGVLGGNYLHTYMYIYIYKFTSLYFFLHEIHVYIYIFILDQEMRVPGFNSPCSRLGWKFMSIQNSHSLALLLNAVIVAHLWNPS